MPGKKIPDQRQIWEREYKVKGKIWRRVPSEDTADCGEGIFVDLGCGDGKNLRRSSQAGNLRIGIDFSKQSLLLSGRDPGFNGIDFICADVVNLPIRSSSVDTADGHHLIGHLSEADRRLAALEISRILKPKGRVIITVFGKSDIRSGKGINIEPDTYLNGNNIITHFFSAHEIKLLFPDLLLISVKESGWIMNIRGVQYPREILVASFIKDKG